MKTVFWLVWFGLSAFVLSVYGWSLRVLFQQKAAWKSFAEKNKMEYRTERLTGPPYMTGRYKGCRLYVYSGVQTIDDISGQRFVTIIEIEIGKGVPVAGAVGTKNLGMFILGLNFEQEYVPNSEYWKSDYVLKTRNMEVMKSFLNEKRIKALHTLFSMKNSSALYFFDDLEAVLRIETSDPLRDPERMEKIFDRIYTLLDELKLSDAEYKKLAKAMKEKKVEPDEDEIEEKDQREEKTEDIKKEKAEEIAKEENPRTEETPLSEKKIES